MKGEWRRFLALVAMFLWSGKPKSEVPGSPGGTPEERSNSTA